MAKKSEEEEIRAEVERVKQELISLERGLRPDENYFSARTMRCCAGK
jgi:hypothetical protein